MQKERTLVLIKPDGIQRTLIGEIIKRYERTGLKLAGLKLVVPKEEMVRNQYLMVDPEWTRKVGEKSTQAYKDKGLQPPFDDPIKCGENVLNILVKYITSGPVVAMVWEGNESISIIRKITGKTEPMTSDIGTIRGDLTIDSYKLADTDGRAVRNLIHASGSIEEAEKEIKIWFKDKELLSYRLVHEAILYDVNLDGTLE